MSNIEKDYFFFINWEDTAKKSFKIGILAQIDDVYYLKLNNRDIMAQAIEEGCIGIPGFQYDRVYRSEELFDFFKRRILRKDAKNVCEELKSTSGRTMVDSFYLNEVPEISRENCKKIILDMYKNQIEINKLMTETQSL